MSDQAWTIESICDALGSPQLAQQFLGEINRAPADRLLAVFAKWERIAEDVRDVVARGREFAAHDERGQQPSGEWIDRTDRVLAEAERNRARGAA